MLKNVLKELSIARAFSVSNIARTLNTSEALVEESINQLSRMGYIVEDMGSPSCETTCSGCSMKSLCNTTPLKTISLTEKGRALLENI